MKPDTFEHPVTILLGLGIPVEVKSLMQAYQILTDWPPTGPARDRALSACRAALNGDDDVQTARAAFVAFAEKQELLAPEFGLKAYRGDRDSEPRVR